MAAFPRWFDDDVTSADRTLPRRALQAHFVPEDAAWGELAVVCARRPGPNKTLVARSSAVGEDGRLSQAEIYESVVGFVGAARCQAMHEVWPRHREKGPRQMSASAWGAVPSLVREQAARLPRDWPWSEDSEFVLAGHPSTATPSISRHGTCTTRDAPIRAFDPLDESNL